ncbi:DNA polymerase III subunit delta' [Shewanella salipaludis]|uniref:DNA-directed DNA polymerase n=1 Tax=Shewanella salipaludis TaxID=2723052 RepID=A0A972JKC1_9GAMM|nr:DNA polymerase III subunit delta' [Shewanella salipaludis]NMH64207.1 DNA polymerase III subunit delta' [Shewanella salipaludis]
MVAGQAPVQEPSLAKLPWLAAATERFIDSLRRNRLSHAQLIGIDSALGGQLLALSMAQAALCQQPTAQGSCGFCKACQLFEAGSHPDFYRVEADGNQIKVDQIRELCHKLSSTAQQGGRRVALLFNCERLNLAAANALLKTLEEPGQNTLLLLQSDTPGRLLPTISSRCQRISFTAPSRADIGHWLTNLYGMQEDVTWCLPVVGGPLALAASLQSGHYQALLALRKDWAGSLSSGHLNASLLEVGEGQIFDALKVLYLVLRQYLLRETQADALERQRVAALAAEVMDQCHSLQTMPNVNYLGLFQRFVLEYKKITTR